MVLYPFLKNEKFAFLEVCAMAKIHKMFSINVGLKLILSDYYLQSKVFPTIEGKIWLLCLLGAPSSFEECIAPANFF
jgi:hypothetical protein